MPLGKRKSEVGECESKRTLEIPDYIQCLKVLLPHLDVPVWVNLSFMNRMCHGTLKHEFFSVCQGIDKKKHPEDYHFTAYQLYHTRYIDRWQWLILIDSGPFKCSPNCERHKHRRRCHLTKNLTRIFKVHTITSLITYAKRCLYPLAVSLYKGIGVTLSLTALVESDFPVEMLWTIRIKMHNNILDFPKFSYARRVIDYLKNCNDGHLFKDQLIMILRCTMNTCARLEDLLSLAEKGSLCYKFFYRDLKLCYWLSIEQMKTLAGKMTEPPKKKWNHIDDVVVDIFDDKFGIASKHIAEAINKDTSAIKSSIITKRLRQGQLFPIFQGVNYWTSIQFGERIMYWVKNEFEPRDKVAYLLSQIHSSFSPYYARKFISAVYFLYITTPPPPELLCYEMERTSDSVIYNFIVLTARLKELTDAHQTKKIER